MIIPIPLTNEILAIYLKINHSNSRANKIYELSHDALSSTGSTKVQLSQNMNLKISKQNSRGRGHNKFLLNHVGNNNYGCFNASLLLLLKSKDIFIMQICSLEEVKV